MLVHSAPLEAQREGADGLTGAAPHAPPSAPEDELPPPYAPTAPTEGTIIEVPIRGEGTGLQQVSAPAAPSRRERRRARWAPSRRDGHQVSLDVIGFGGDIDGAAFAGDWRFRARRSLFTLVRLGPLAFGKAGVDRIGVADASVVLGYDARLVAVGAGVGVAYLRVDEVTRRSEGAAPIGRLHLRAGALEGLHAQLDLGATLIEQDLVGTHVNLRLRFPLRRGRLFDVVIEAMPAASWVQLQVGLVMHIPGLPSSRWRFRPHGGLVEVIDPIGRDGGAALGFGIQLIYLEPTP